MTKQEVSERFSGGHVKHMVTTHKAVQWLGRILGIVICVCLLYTSQQHHADLGIANDGDADRCLLVDEKGQVLDGDQIMLLCALKLKEEGKLKGDTVVGTVMSNIGFHKAAEELGMKTVSTAVGARYVCLLYQYRRV